MTDRIRERTAALLGILFILSGMLMVVFPGIAGWWTQGWLPVHLELSFGIALAVILGGVGLFFPKTKRVAGASLAIALFVFWGISVYPEFFDRPFESFELIASD